MPSIETKCVYVCVDVSYGPTQHAYTFSMDRNVLVLDYA